MTRKLHLEQSSVCVVERHESLVTSDTPGLGILHLSPLSEVRTEESHSSDPKSSIQLKRQ